MTNYQKTFFQTLQKTFGNPKAKLKALPLEESKKECEKIKATPKEIKKALKDCIHFVCENCGYHSGIIRRCPACGGWLRYWQLYERILEERKLNEESTSALGLGLTTCEE